MRALWEGGRSVGGVGGACGMILFLYSFLLLFIPGASGLMTVHCVQFGQSSFYGPYTIGAERLRPRDRGAMVASLLKVASGQKSFEGPDAPQGTCKTGGWDYKKNSYDPYYAVPWDFCPADVTIKPYLVRQGNKTLNGWLHVEVEYTGNDDMDFIYVQVRDEVFNAIGEFVTDPKEQCPSTSDKLITPTKYQYLPCSAVGLREAKASQGIFVAARNQYNPSEDTKLPSADYDKYLGTKDLKKGIQFTWRLNEYWCNRHPRFRIDAEVWPSKRAAVFKQDYIRDFDIRVEKNTPEDMWGQELCKNKSIGMDCRMQRKATHWMEHKWFGAADIKIADPSLPLTCNFPVLDENSDFEKLTTEAKNSWFSDAKILEYKDDYMGASIPGKGLYQKGCQVHPLPAYNFGQSRTRSTRDGQIKVIENVVTFGGRCNSHYEKNVSRDYLPGCEHDVSTSAALQTLDLSLFTSYKDYRKNLFNLRILQCKNNCTYPTNATEVGLTPVRQTEETGPDTRRPPVSFETLSKARTKDRFESSWHARKFHGNLFIFIAMFLMPNSIFFIRYYKETFMEHMAAGIGAWYWFHIVFVCVTPVFYLSGRAALHLPMENYGLSLSPHATVHVFLGRAFMCVFLAMALLGALRPLALVPRIVCSALHSITGFTLYLIAMALVIDSSNIPGSPTLDDCDKKLGTPIGFSFTAQMGTAWLIIDFLFHLMLTVVQFAIDKGEGIKRKGFGLPFDPMLPADYPADLVGHRFRKLILGLYVMISLSMTLTLIIVIFNRDEPPTYCIMGNMTCNLNEFRPGMRSGSPFGCGFVPLKYYEIVFKRYAINTTQAALTVAGVAH